MASPRGGTYTRPLSSFPPRRAHPLRSQFWKACFTQKRQTVPSASTSSLQQSRERKSISTSLAFTSSLIAPRILVSTSAYTLQSLAACLLSLSKHMLLAPGQLTAHRFLRPVATLARD